MKISLKMAVDPEAVLKRRGLESGGRLQKLLESEVIRQCQPYVPFDEGILAGSGRPWPRPGGGAVMWPGPYAHYQYMGEVYGPNIPMTIGGERTFRSPAGQKKRPTGRELQYSKERNPLAGSRWVERMMADKRGEIVTALASVAASIWRGCDR